MTVMANLKDGLRARINSRTSRAEHIWWWQTCRGLKALPRNRSAGRRNTTTDLHLKLSAVQEQVVVSASLGGALAPQIGSSVTVVSQEEIEDQGTETRGGRAAKCTGVAINRTGQQGAVTSAFIRGGNSNYNLVMVDGIPMNDFGGGFDLAPLPTDGVDQVELTRGPGKRALRVECRGWSDQYCKRSR